MHLVGNNGLPSTPSTVISAVRAVRSMAVLNTRHINYHSVYRSMRAQSAVAIVPSAWSQRRQQLPDASVKLKLAEIVAGQLPVLPFQGIDCDGGAYGYAFGNVLQLDETVYCSTKASNVNMLFAFTGTGSFELSSFTIRVPASGFTAPCYDGLLFVSHEPISFAETMAYDGMTESTYTELVVNGITTERDRTRLEPVAYFRLGGAHAMTVHLNAARSGRYVLLKLLRPIRGDNIDIQFVGFHGRYGPRAFASGALR